MKPAKPNPIDYASAPPPTAKATTRLVAEVVLACAAIFLLVGLAVAGGSWPMLLHGLIVGGGVLILWLVAATGWGSLVLRLPQLKCVGPTALSLSLPTSAALGLGIMSLLVLLLGLAGLLSFVAGVLLLAIGILIAGYRLFVWAKHRTDSTAAPTKWSWLWLLVMPLAAIAFVGALVPPGILWGDEPHGYDVVEYHLQVPREWYESGRIEPLAHNVFSYFPFNVEMHYLLAMHLTGGPRAGMYLAQMMHAAYFALTAWAIYGLVRERSGAANATIAGVATAAVPWTALLAPVAYNEGALVLYGALSIGWTLRALRSRDGVLSNFIIAGLMAGFACGAKLTAVPLLLIGLPLAALIAWAAGRAGDEKTPFPRLVFGVILFGMVGTVAFSPWLIRNAVWIGNPVYPEGAAMFGRGPRSEQQLETWRRATSPTEAQRSIRAKAAAAWDQVIVDWRYGFILLPLGIVAGFVTRHRREACLLLVLLCFLAVFWLFFTHLQSRFFVLAIPIAALLIGSVDDHRWSIVAGTIVGIVAVVSTGQVYSKLMTVDQSIARQTRGFGIFAMLGFEDLDNTAATGFDTFPPDATLVLVGDAGAFNYNLPMSRLRYKTVFDVDASKHASVVDAWTDGLLTSGGPTIFLVHPTELQRFHDTYGTPALDEDVRGPRDRPFVLRK